MSDDVLRFEDLTVDFQVGGTTHRAVDKVSFAVRPGEVLAVVGESGSGKSVTSLAALGLLPPNASVGGRISFAGEDVLAMSRAELTALRGRRVAMIFQDPVGALDPVFSIGYQLIEMIRAHQPSLSRAEVRSRAIELLELVGIPEPEARLRYYPHQLSGGQCQRVMIAIAVACDPELLIADEPTTALDVTVQQEVLDVLLAMRSKISGSILIITHDMGVVADVADRVVVMRQGSVVETAEVHDLFDRPSQPYTKALLDAVPRSRGRDSTASGVDGGVVPALAIESLVVEYRGRRGKIVRAVDDVNLELKPGEITGLVGESGSGKSTIGKSVLGLAPITAGQVRVAGQPMTAGTSAVLREARSRIGVVFQNPTGSLNPRATIGQSIGEPLAVHRGVRGVELRGRVEELLESVELPSAWYGRYPHELSGGQRQRVSIARAISLDPALLIADEPTSALDVSVQATVLELFRSVQERFDFACLFISHDLAVVDQVSDRVAVMSGGRIVEQGDREAVLRAPQDPYTVRLLEAAPVPDPREQTRRRGLRLAG
ncbi:peptide/nickel transport system ATP-binding protein [Kribbella sp. VKM Ac-2527]|uniref:Peptide/nickel transport system ATP-binding protein n=1 Tax=Kribbella caucasensis TaxID=2512215 RepID=A0A4R6KLW9_9ACTN|nr:ABC transporter ATP-binding protein [Kribbella sp. VKM Ac-2527]TDO52557.1 peptide/nickel transport system ATP-binding protein [Kribbella sp. VKM Ac-2527]